MQPLIEEHPSVGFFLKIGSCPRLIEKPRLQGFVWGDEISALGSEVLGSFVFKCAEISSVRQSFDEPGTRPKIRAMVSLDQLYPDKLGG